MAERACLEPMARRGFERGADAVGGQRPRQLAADGRDPQMWPEILVGGGQKHIGIDRRAVDAAVRSEMDAVDPHQSAGLVRGRGQARGIGDRAERVRRERERDDPRTLADQRYDRIHLQGSLARIKRRRPHGETAVGSDEQPRRDVRIVVELGDDDLVALLERPGDGVGEQEVDRGRVGAEHDLLRAATEEVGRGEVSVVDQLLGGHGGHERTAEVRVRADQVIGHRAGDRVGRLRTARAVEVDRRLAVHPAVERGEPRPDCGHIERPGHGDSLSHRRPKAWLRAA